MNIASSGRWSVKVAHLEYLGYTPRKLKYVTMFRTPGGPSCVRRNYHGSGGDSVQGGAWNRHTDGFKMGRLRFLRRLLALHVGDDRSVSSSCTSYIQIFISRVVRASDLRSKYAGWLSVDGLPRAIRIVQKGYLVIPGILELVWISSPKRYRFESNYIIGYLAKFILSNK